MALCSSVVFSVLCDVNEGQGRADEEEAESGSGADEAEGGGGSVRARQQICTLHSVLDNE